MFSIIERKSTWVLLAALFFGLAGSAAADFRPAQGPKAEGEYIVVFHSGHPARNAAHELAASHGGSAKRVWDRAVNGAHFINMNEAAARALPSPRPVLCPTTRVPLPTDHPNRDVSPLIGTVVPPSRALSPESGTVRLAGWTVHPAG